MAGVTKRIDNFYREAAANLPTSVECKRCGVSISVDPEKCLREGWPICCGQTMSLRSAGRALTPMKGDGR